MPQHTVAEFQQTPEMMLKFCYAMLVVPFCTVDLCKLWFSVIVAIMTNKNVPWIFRICCLAVNKQLSSLFPFLHFILRYKLAYDPAYNCNVWYFEDATLSGQSAALGELALAATNTKTTKRTYKNRFCSVWREETVHCVRCVYRCSVSVISCLCTCHHSVCSETSGVTKVGVTRCGNWWCHYFLPQQVITA